MHSAIDREFEWTRRGMPYNNAAPESLYYRCSASADCRLPSVVIFNKWLVSRLQCLPDLSSVILFFVCSFIQRSLSVCVCVCNLNSCSTSDRIHAQHNGMHHPSSSYSITVFCVNIIFLLEKGNFVDTRKQMEDKTKNWASWSQSPNMRKLDSKCTASHFDMSLPSTAIEQNTSSNLYKPRSNWEHLFLYMS